MFWRCSWMSRQYFLSLRQGPDSGVRRRYTREWWWERPGWRWSRGTGPGSSIFSSTPHRWFLSSPLPCISPPWWPHSDLSMDPLGPDMIKINNNECQPASQSVRQYKLTLKTVTLTKLIMRGTTRLNHGNKCQKYLHYFFTLPILLWIISINIHYNTLGPPKQGETKTYN